MRRNETNAMGDEVAEAVAEAFSRTTGEVDSADLHADNLIEWLAVNGYAVVKLPSMVTNQDGQSTWPIPEIDRWADVFVRQSDNRIAINAVPNPIAKPEHALSLAAALIAAARYVQEKQGG